MKDTKLLETLKILSDSEIEAIKDLLKSNFIMNGVPQKEATALLNYLLQFRDDWESEGLNKETVFKKLYGTKTPFNNRLAKSMTALMNLIDYYFVHFSIKLSSIEENLRLATFYQSRGLSGRSEIYYKRLDDYFSNRKDLCLQFYNHQLSFLEEIYHTNKGLAQKKELSLEKLLFQHKKTEMIKKMEILVKEIYPRFKNEEKLVLICQTTIKEIEATPEYLEDEFIELFYLSLLMGLDVNNKEENYYPKYKHILYAIEQNLESNIRTLFFSIERNYLFPLG